MKSKYKADVIHVVTEVVNGEDVKTRLPKEEAERLYRKMRAKGINADIHPEESAEIEPYVSGFEIEA